MYPTPGAYQEAVQFPAAAFVDDDLKEAEPEANTLGLPKAVTGAFAAVFPMRTRAQRWAVKCFLTPAPDQQARYAAVARHLEKARLPYAITFDYRHKGIFVDGQALPVLKMEWIEGTPLNQFVAQHLEDPDMLEGLAARWVEMAADLEKAGVAHGDFQHGNVLILEEGGRLRLTLIDYDTMYVPALRGRKSPEVGHRNYQHPDRNENDFGPYLDRFAGLVIYTALQACRHRPGLFQRYDTGENLLFCAGDFYDPDASPLFKDLAGIEALQPLVEALRTACYLEPEAVPSLAEVLEGAVGARARRGRTRRSEAVRGRAGHRRSRPRTTFERLFMPAVVGWTAVAAAMLTAGWAAPGLGLLAAGAFAAAWLISIRHTRLPTVRRRRRLRREIAYFDRILHGLHRQIDALQRERGRLLAGVDAMRAERLEEVQAEALENRLKYHFTGDAEAFEGITHKVVVRLKGAGLRNAFQVTPERLARIKSLSDESRACVLLWRAALARQYEGEIPGELSPAEERRFQRFVEHRLTGFSEEIMRLKEKIQVQQRELAQVTARFEALPPVSSGRYLRFLLRLGSLPAQQPLPPKPVAAPTPGERRRAEPVTPPTPDDAAPWWQQVE